ncbi:hypothetical protein [Martelella alba]|uniref:hypothetical protein n=1 Tax=Martelella alba TaxID=2590451 RepID=UPI0015E84C43|nr:hypothetical protein [Martelella alba]
MTNARSNRSNNAFNEGRSRNAFYRFAKGVGSFIDDYAENRAEAFRRSPRTFD